MIPMGLLGAATPRASGGGGGGDPDFASVVALLHFDGADASTTFTDVTGRAWTGTGGAALSTSSPILGSASFLNDGASLKSVETVSAIPNIALDQNYTIELWIRPSNVSGLRPIFTIYTSGGSHQLIVYAFGTDVTLESPAALGDPTYTAGFTVGTDYHLAISRQGTNTRVFVNGALLGTWANSGFAMLGRHVRIGRDSGNNWRYAGRMDEFRLTIGVARYTAAFTPPSSPFPDS